MYMYCHSYETCITRHTVVILKENTSNRVNLQCIETRDERQTLLREITVIENEWMTAIKKVSAVFHWQ